MNADSLTINHTGATPGENPIHEKQPSPSWVKQLGQCVMVAVLATLSYFFISRYVLQSVQVAGASMTPTLHDAAIGYAGRMGRVDFRSNLRGSAEPHWQPQKSRKFVSAVSSC